ncbi:tRNA pseudouridine38-40 synthase [Paenibacillus sp. UNCCL117]|uniref:tRNA pseudouridine(38-40) synthase TruA n=1 Tax=unclassified Paenibacillus TaxID=185978 RepID=UPI0008826678|nr:MULTISPECIES: tRNA pseudouridine(38-40) synthase TruA [unclassified Paenibacillus]SDE57642.1 tRNA pseudouridine38-40 synthase [Paenibacillus sp. cl123]SFW68438.1 tRNA pseudouridine38-40 synthase [Paenibacillus sp. UNCCL117]
MRNLCVTVCYDGAGYCGFQTQPGLNTVQHQLEQAIRLLTGEEVKIHASGRTDAGVHARGQVFHFHTGAKIPLDRWAMALNGRLPHDIRIWDVREVPLEFHARRWAKRKTYRYTIRSGKYFDPMTRHMEFYHPTALNLDAMRQALTYIEGEHDFTSFCSIRTNAVSHVRTIYEARLELAEKDEHLRSSVIHIYLTGNGFLYNMVRIIVGTLLQIGEGKRDASEMKRILEAQSRAAAGPTAMAHGLMLWEVFYEETPVTT